MKGIGILAAEWFITSLIVYAGLSGKQILFINGPRSAVITLGAIGFAMCMVMPTIGKFISNAPAHPLTRSPAHHHGVYLWDNRITYNSNTNIQMENPHPL